MTDDHLRATPTLHVKLFPTRASIHTWALYSSTKFSYCFRLPLNCTNSSSAAWNFVSIVCMEACQGYQQNTLYSVCFYCLYGSLSRILTKYTLFCLFLLFVWKPVKDITKYTLFCLFLLFVWKPVKDINKIHFTLFDVSIVCMEACHVY